MSSKKNRRKTKRAKQVQAKHEQMVDPLVVSLSATARLLGVSRPTIDKWWKNGEGPERYYLGNRRVVYRLDELKDWIDGLEKRPRTNTGYTGNLITPLFKNRAKRPESEGKTE